jgi:hypothetical protein
MTSKWYEKVKRTRLDEEDAIMDCWKVVDDINFLWVQIIDGPDMDNDEICNILLGMQQLYERKFKELETTFHQAHDLDTTPPAGEWDDDRIDIIGQNGNDGEHYDQKIDAKSWPSYDGNPSISNFDKR